MTYSASMTEVERLIAGIRNDTTVDDLPERVQRATSLLEHCDQILSTVTRTVNNIVTPPTQ